MLDKLKPVVQLDTIMAISKTVGWLREQLEARTDGLLVMDCRAQELYESSHVESAINVAIPSLMLRRLKKGNLPVRSLLSDGEDREKFVRRCKTDTIVLYDEYSREWNENVDGGSVLGLLLRRMKDEGYKAYYLEGECASFTFRRPRFIHAFWLILQFVTSECCGAFRCRLQSNISVVARLSRHHNRNCDG